MIRSIRNNNQYFCNNKPSFKGVQGIGKIGDNLDLIARQVEQEGFAHVVTYPIDGERSIAILVKDEFSAKKRQLELAIQTFLTEF